MLERAQTGLFNKAFGVALASTTDRNPAAAAGTFFFGRLGDTAYSKLSSTPLVRGLRGVICLLVDVIILVYDIPIALPTRIAACAPEEPRGVGGWLGGALIHLFTSN